MRLILNFVAVMATILSIVLYYAYVDTKAKLVSAEAKLQQAYKTLDEAKDDAFTDCQVIRNSDRRMYIVDGCVMAVDQICHDQAKDVKACLTNLIKVCDTLVD